MATEKPPKPGLPVSSELLEKLQFNDPDAWFSFFRQVYVIAREAIAEAMADRRTQAGKEASRLAKAYAGDHDGACGELAMAWDSFRGHFLRKDRPLEEIRTEADFSAWLIGVAYNRWQRGHYQDRKAARQTALGAASRRGGKSSVLDRHADQKEGPEVAVDLADFRDALREELQRFTAHLSDVDREIIRLSFCEGRTPQEIKALVVKASLARCEEAPRLWLRHLAQRYPHTLDFLSDGPGLT